MDSSTADQATSAGSVKMADSTDSRKAGTASAQAIQLVPGLRTTTQTTITSTSAPTPLSRARGPWLPSKRV